MAAKWRRRSDPSMASVTPGPVTRNKREEHPSPAYDSPMADIMRGSNVKRVRFQNPPLFPPPFVFFVANFQSADSMLFICKYVKLGGLLLYPVYRAIVRFYRASLKLTCHTVFSLSPQPPICAFFSRRTIVNRLLGKRPQMEKFMAWALPLQAKSTNC